MDAPLDDLLPQLEGMVLPLQQPCADKGDQACPPRAQPGEPAFALTLRKAAMSVAGLRMNL